MSAVRFEPNFDKPLQIKPPPPPDPANDSDLIAELSRETRELREELARINANRARQSGEKLIGAKPIVLRHISDIVAEDREPEWLIEDILERNVLAVLAGPRGTLKSFIALDWAMRVALNNNRVVMLSAEGQGLGNRVCAWMSQHFEGGGWEAEDLKHSLLQAYELPINLNSPVELELLREACDLVSLIVVDTFSKFSAGIDENSNGEVAAFLSGLSSLRDQFGCTVLLVAHSGHGDSKRPRGANALMSNPDCEFIVERTGMTVTVSRDRYKDSPSLPPLAYEAKVVDLGRVDRRGRPVTSLALVTTEAPVAPAKGRGGNQDKTVVALKEWQRTNPEASDISTIDLTALLKAQGIKDRRRRREVLDSFVNAKILTHSVGGYLIHGEYL